MAKPKSPLLSLGARGTIADALTYQKRGREHIVREKPIPTDPYSLNQAYQRWDYRDYAYLWTLLSDSEKQVYRTKASRYHITGFSQWMRESLKELTSLEGRWHLDEKAGAIAYDSSKNENNAIIRGATPASGLIAGAYSFDGLNDWIELPNDPSLEYFTIKSISFFFKAPAFTGAERYIYDFGYWVAPYGDRCMLSTSANTILFGFRNTAGTYINTSIPFTPGTWHHFLWSWDGTKVIFYKDGIDIESDLAFSGTMACSLVPPYIGRRSPGRWYDGLLDEFRIDRRVLDPTEILRHSKRRYPA